MSEFKDIRSSEWKFEKYTDFEFNQAKLRDYSV